MSEELYHQVKQAAADGGLDGLVHEVASALASTTNNSSLPKQKQQQPAQADAVAVRPRCQLRGNA
jgi:hypothetical protein